MIASGQVDTFWHECVARGGSEVEVFRAHLAEWVELKGGRVSLRAGELCKEVSR